MGDRANVYIHEDDQPGVYLYTHWGGTELPKVLQTALARRERWDDQPYLTRIVFCEMVKGRETDTTGHGISTDLCDNEHLILSVNTNDQTVSFEPEENGNRGKPVKVFTFEEYVNATPQEIRAIYLGD